MLKQAKPFPPQTRTNSGAKWGVNTSSQSFIHRPSTPMMAEGSYAVALLYTGEEGAVVPQDVIRIRVDPSVTSIPVQAFIKRNKLADVELSEGLVEIGARSFCDHSITKINIPTSLRRINTCAFSYSLRTPIHLHDGIESIGRGAFSYCIFTNFRIPPLITVIPQYMLSNCTLMFSLEFSDIVTEIGSEAFCECYSLRNVAIPPNAVFGDDVFIEEDYNVMTDLQQLFGDSNARIIWELQHRFDGLPIHRLVYYQSYYQGVLQRLIAAINLRSGQRRTLRSKLDPTGNQQDCLGMTPLHILACSSVHDIEVYRVIVENYHANLVTEDRWGALPLLYAFWGAAPTEIIEFLLESYQTLNPGYEFNWTIMVETMGRTDTPKESIENLLRVKQLHFPEQPINWEYLLDNFATPSSYNFQSQLRERMQFLVMCGFSTRVEALPFKIWRDCISNMIQTSNFLYNGDNSSILREIQDKIAHFEDELSKLKEATTILEIALWKVRMNIPKEVIFRHQKEVRVDLSEF
jgi:hypothetical protein